MKRILWILPVLLLIALPVAAQSAVPTPLDWIPADFTGFVRVDLADSQMTLTNLNVALFVASVLQPTRATFSQAQSYDTFFPLTIFDTENASFTQDVMPWLKGEAIIAYHSLSAQFNADASSTIMILPTKDAFASANFMSAVVKAQDLLKRETYRDAIVYNGDKTSFAFLPSAVLVGPQDLLHETLDTLSGNGKALTADPVYRQVRAALPQKSLVLGYLSKDAAAHALSVLVSGSDAADPFLTAITQSLAGLDKTPERLLMSGALDGIGIGLDYDQIHSTRVSANVVLHTVSAPDVTSAPFDPTVLNLIPRSAMVVQSGSDASSAATDALYSLPFLNFASQALAAFPVGQATPTPLQAPTAQDVQAAVSGFLNTIKPVVDVQSEVLDKLRGSYSLALLPRPNDPMPGSNAPFDVLLVVQTASPESAKAVEASASKLLATFTAPLQDEQLDSQTFQTLRTSDTGEPLVRVGAVDNLVVIGTGSAAQLALDAQRGDNRLIKQDRWQNLSQNDQIPYVYIDVNAFYNTFLPTVGGSAVRPVSQLGIQSRYLGNQLFELDMLVGLTQQ